MFRGVLRGEHNVIIVDYLVISFIGTDVYDVSHYLFSNDFLEDFYTIESNVKGFQWVFTNGKIFFHYLNEGEKDVVLLEVKSKGCRYLEDRPNHSWKYFFKVLSEVSDTLLIEKFNVKRLDIAIDSFDSKGLTTDRLQTYFQRKLLSSRFRTVKFIREYQINSGSSTGDSIYLGSRLSDLSILVYDKKLESDTTREKHFRTEIRFKNDRGKQAMYTLLDDSLSFSNFIVSILRSKLQFRSSTSKNKEIRRRPLAKWYEDYLSYVKNMTLYKL